MSTDDYSILRANSLHANDNKIHKTTNNNSPAGSSNLNPRSCVTCRRRKVKCDKNHPCSNCVRQNIECVFPAPGRAPRKPRKPLDGELADRLRRLESLVQSLGSQVREEESTPPTDGGEKEKDDTPDGKEETQDEKIKRAKKELKSLMKEKMDKQEKDNPADTDTLNTRFGKLIVHEGRSRYISPGMWAGLKTELEDIKSDRDLLDSSEEDDDYPSPSQLASTSTISTFIFNHSSANVDMSLLHPQQPEHVAIYWKIYKENVESLIKTFHIPTREPAILANANRLGSLPRPDECTMFSIYFAAVTSVKNDECLRLFGEARNDLLARFKFGMEQSLARADFLKTDSIFVLQAFILFLVCLRPSEDPRIIWSLTSLAVRMAQGLGLHRDGSHFPNLSPYKQEMRRRLWWHATVLDLRASEDLGTDPTVYDMMSDVAMPRNLNDSDISFDMTELPESRIGCTDMTFSLIRFEINRLHRFLAFVPPGKCPSAKAGRFMGPHHHGFEDKKEKLEQLTKRIEEQYLHNIDYQDPLQWITAKTARLILSKMKLMLYVPFQRKDGGASLPQNVRDELFHASLENVETAVSYQAQIRAQKYTWLLRTYTQWHALAFLLRELCVRTTGEDVERAWKAVDLTMAQQIDEISKLAGHLWKPVQALRDKARREREKALFAETTSNGQQMDVIPDSMALNHNLTASGYANGSGIMNMDFGVEKLYPAPDRPKPASEMDTTGALQQAPMMWQSPGFQLPQTTAPMPMGSNMTIPTVMTDIQPIQGTSMQEFDATTVTNLPGWTGTNENYNFDDSTMTMGDDTMNWATWDDMVQQLVLQNELHPDAHTVPGFFGAGMNLF